MNSLGSRIKIIRGTANQIQFSADMGIPQTNLSRYERDVSVPDLELLVRLADKYGVSLEWLIAGRGSMRPEGSESIPNELSQPVHHDEAVRRLEARLDASENERRELCAENRQLHRDKAELLRENGELREKVARLEERKRRHDLTHGMPSENSDVA